MSNDTNGFGRANGSNYNGNDSRRPRILSVTNGQLQKPQRPKIIQPSDKSLQEPQDAQFSGSASTQSPAALNNTNAICEELPQVSKDLQTRDATEATIADESVTLADSLDALPRTDTRFVRNSKSADAVWAEEALSFAEDDGLAQKAAEDFAAIPAPDEVVSLPVTKNEHVMGNIQENRGSLVESALGFISKIKNTLLSDVELPK